jgi:NAD(P)-dependent dehydrogenase (short-subunit alcohol dehydrogenase family)
MNTLPLQSNRVLILGGSGAMGQAIAAAVIAAGATAILAGRDATRLSEAARARLAATLRRSPPMWRTPLMPRAYLSA